jgi:hypothetical protein
MQATHPEAYRAERPLSESATPARQARQAYHLLHVGFIVLPLIAGLDKFTMFLADWPKYLSPAYQGILPLSAPAFMMAVGIVEILAGLLVAIKPKIGATVVGVWLVAIVINLVLHPAGYLDIALRDVGLAIAAFALAALSPHSRSARVEA